MSYGVTSTWQQLSGRARSAGKRRKKTTRRATSRPASARSTARRVKKSARGKGKPGRGRSKSPALTGALVDTISQYQASHNITFSEALAHFGVSSAKWQAYQKSQQYF